MMTKRKFVTIMSIVTLITSALLTLYNNDFKVTIAAVVSLLIGWAIGIGVLILLINKAKLFHKRFEK